MNRRMEAAAATELARLAFAEGDLNQALAHTESAVKAAETVLFPLQEEPSCCISCTKEIIYAFHVRILMQLHARDPHVRYDVRAFEANEKLLAALERWSQHLRERQPGVAPELAEQENRIRREILDDADSRLRLPSMLTEEEELTVRRKTTNLVSEYRRIQSLVRASKPQYSLVSEAMPVTLKTVQAHLDPDTVLLEYVIGQDASYLWAVSPGYLRTYELPRKAVVADAVIRLQRVVSSRGLLQEYEAAATALSQMLLGPAAQDLRNKRLLIVPDGILRMVPFAALPLPGAGPAPMIAKVELTVVPSAAALIALREEKKTRPRPSKLLAVFADPVFHREDARVPSDGTSQENAASLAVDLERSAVTMGLIRHDRRFPRLLATRAEAHNALSLVPAKAALKALDFGASRDLALGPQLEQFRVVHFATHALINEEHPELSGLVLSLVDKTGTPKEGFLRILDIHRMRLNADLVVLSACQTALAREIRGEGMVGLTRGFMYAGASRVMASLWRIDDRATAELMRRFYRELFTRAQSPSGALRTAQLGMLSQKRWNHPYYWAGFIMQGEWR
jgi:CHAT domain-containing protein